MTIKHTPRTLRRLCDKLTQKGKPCEGLAMQGEKQCFYHIKETVVIAATKALANRNRSQTAIIRRRTRVVKCF